MLIVLATSPRVAPGLLSWPAWQALRSASAVLAPPGHPQLPALDDAGIAYQVAEEPPSDPDGGAVWLPMPGGEPAVPPGARLVHGSADLPGAARRRPPLPGDGPRLGAFRPDPGLTLRATLYYVQHVRM